MLVVLLSCLIVSLISLMAVFFVSRFKLLDESKQYFLTSFAAGVMIAAAFLDLMPESSSVLGDKVFFPAMAGLILFFLVDRFTVWHSHSRGDKSSVGESVGPKILIGDTIHNFIDGVVIAASFLISFPVGVSVTLAICAHEIPQEMADFGLLIKSGMKPKKAIVLNFISALFALLGGLLGYIGLGQHLNEISTLTALAGGMFLYIACVDLIPSLRNEKQISSKVKILSTTLFIFGLIVVYMLGKLS